MDSTILETEIIQYIESHEGIYVKITSTNDILKIHNLIFNGIIDDDNNSDIVNLYHGYYCRRRKDYPQMIKYYLLAIEQGNSNAMNNLGYYYELEKDYELMVKYYLLAIEYGNSQAMINLGVYYEKQKDYELMIKYYLLAIELTIDHGKINSIVKLGYYYQEQKDYELMLKYYLLAIEYHNPTAMNNSGTYYANQKDYVSMLKYYLLAIEYHCLKAMGNLGDYYKQEKDYESMLKYYFLNLKHGGVDTVSNIIAYCQENNAIDVFVQLYTEFSHIIWITPEDKTQLIQIILKFLAKDLISEDLVKIIIDIDVTGYDNIDPTFKFIKRILAEKINLIDLHFNYSPNMTGCIEAKNDFINRVL